QEPVVGDRRLPRVNHGKGRSRRGNRPPLVGEPFDVRGRDGHSVSLPFEAESLEFDQFTGGSLKQPTAKRTRTTNSRCIIPSECCLMIAPIRNPLFELGQVVATPAAMKAIDESGEEIADYLTRHAFGDWGSVFNKERERNDAAVKE